jgi:hypothetical protein
MTARVGHHLPPPPTLLLTIARRRDVTRHPTPPKMGVGGVIVYIDCPGPPHPGLDPTQARTTVRCQRGRRRREHSALFHKGEIGFRSEPDQKTQPTQAGQHAWHFHSHLQAKLQLLLQRLWMS